MYCVISLFCSEEERKKISFSNPSLNYSFFTFPAECYHSTPAPHFRSLNSFLSLSSGPDAHQRDGGAGQTELLSVTTSAAAVFFNVTVGKQCWVVRWDTLNECLENEDHPPEEATSMQDIKIGG